MALCLCKVLASRLKTWNDKDGDFVTVAVDIAKELDEFLAMEETDKANAVQALNGKMRFAHIWIPAKEKEKYNEDKKTNISINNAAMKHILLAAASHKKGAFAPKEYMELVVELMRVVFVVLGNHKAYSSEHAFLKGIYISHFSICPSVASNKQALARDVSVQCRTLLEEAMTEVSTGSAVSFM